MTTMRSARREDLFGELRSLLHATPTEERWERVCAIVDAWPAGHVHEVAIPYALDQLSAWPARMRRPTSRMRDDIARGTPPPSVSLCTGLPLGFNYFLTNQRVTNEALVTLLESGYAAHVTHLQLSSQPVGDHAMRYLAQHAQAHALETLTLDFTCVTHKGVRHIAASPLMRTLKRVVWSNLDLEDDACLALAEELTARTSLQELDLSSNRLTDRGVARLASCAGMRGLKRLDLSFNALTDDAAFALASSPHLKLVARLAIDYNDISMAGWRALVHSSNFWRAEVSCYPTR